MEAISGDLKEQKWSEKNVLKAMAFILFCSYFSSGYERLVCFINCNCCVSKPEFKHRYVIWVISDNNFFVSMSCICENAARRDIRNSYSNRRYLV